MTQALQAVGARARAWHDWLAARPRLLLVLAVLAALGPFLGKPFNIDDPLFLWAARQIQAHPANPYGFDLNWYGYLSPMWDVSKNPPLACYLIAVAAAVLGWSEVALHSVFSLAAVAAILGTFRLAGRLCRRPLVAAFATLVAPAFWVSSTTVMCDTLLLAFWVWAIVLWIEGVEDRNLWGLVGSAILVALASLTKYFGVCLVPLLFLYSLAQGRKSLRWTALLLIPLVVLAAYQWAGQSLYGKGLVSDAGSYAATVRGHVWASLMAAVPVTLAFTGGCLAVATLLMAWLWRSRVLVGFALLGLLAEFAVFKGYLGLPLSNATSPRRLLEIQVIFWAVGGASILALAAVDLWRHRDAPSWLLASWVFGTFLFAGFVNWTTNARSILPMVPAVAILLARRLSEARGGERPLRRWGVGLSLLASTVLGFCVTRADFLLAGAVRESARESYAKLESKQGTVWFGGHWGFQYYLEALGQNAKPVVNGHLKAKQGDILANPVNNTNVEAPRSPQVDSSETQSTQGPRWLTTLSREAGAGFYASVWGPLPFAFTEVPPEKVTIYHLVPTADITLVSADRADLDCASHESIQHFHCGFASEVALWQGDERNKLQPVYTRDRHLYLVPGLFLEPAIQARFQTEAPDKPREQLKRFTADCRVQVIGTLTGVRTRWLADGAWSGPQDIEVATISRCQIEG